jgi:hypothetical protein
MEVRQPFLREQVERDRDARRKADPFRAIAERTQMTVWVRVGRRVSMRSCTTGSRSARTSTLASVSESCVVIAPWVARQG